MQRRPVMPSQEREILTVKDIAELMQCSVSHVLNLMNGKVKGAPQLPYVPSGRRRLVSRDTFMEWFRSQEKRGIAA